MPKKMNMKKVITTALIALLFSSCMTTYNRVGNCKYKYRPSLKGAAWRHL
jgi:PBP1b-binding outer membrane lipoprotein LpoB